MKKIPVLVAIILILLPLLLSCAPKTASPPTALQTTPVPQPTATAVAPTATAPKPATPAVSDADAEWAKVLEAAKKEGKVTLYTFLFGAQHSKVTETAFHEKYPDIELEWVPLSTAVRVERIKTETRMGTYIADTSDGSAPFQANLKKEGLTQSLGTLPSTKESPWPISPIRDKEGHIVSIALSITSLWANATLVKPGEEPKSLKDLLDPKWKGKIILSEPATSNTSSRIYAMYTSRNLANDDYFMKLGPQLKFVTGSVRDITLALARGEAPVAWGSSGDGNRLVSEGAPVRPIDIEEGVLGSSTTMSMLKSAPHPNATRVFVNWLLSKEGQTTLAKMQSQSSWRTDVPDFAPPSAQIKWKTVHTASIEDEEAAERAFSSRKLVDMWGRK